MILRSGDIEVDDTLYELRRGARRIPVQPRVFDLLRCLMRHAPRVVTRGELRSEVWHGAHVCAAAAARAVCACRKALEDDETLIQTVRGRGYRFAGDVELAGASDPERVRIGGGGDAAAASGTWDASAASGQASIVLGGDRELLERVVAYASQHGVEVRTL